MASPSLFFCSLRLVTSTKTFVFSRQRQSCFCTIHSDSLRRSTTVYIAENNALETGIRVLRCAVDTNTPSTILARVVILELTNAGSCHPHVPFRNFAFPRPQLVPTHVGHVKRSGATESPEIFPDPMFNGRRL